MDNQRSSSTRKANPSLSVATHLRYPHRLNFYEQPPLGEVTLEEFETWAIDRLRVLAEIEASLIRNRTFEEIKLVVKSQSSKYLNLSATTAHERDLDAERKKDHVSHFILRLAFCRTEELRRRFVKAETVLFRARYEDEDTKSREAFLAAHGTESAETVSEGEKERLKAKLAAASGISETNVEKETYIKLPWTKVTSLVERRRVFLSKGMAYVPQREQSSVILQDFQSKLERALERTGKALPELDEDDRLVPILEHLSKGFMTGIASEYTFGDEVVAGDAVTADMVDEMAVRHWPLCMRHLHETMRRDKHLKHYGRLQYGLFLKAIGMSLEEAMIFWRKSFSNVTDDKFNKEYRYNIRHSYGLEGKRTNYPAKSCARIITTDPPGSGDSHGCPFRHFSPENLTMALGAHYRITSPPDIAEIQNAIKSEKWYIACTRVFEITHGVKRGDGLGDGDSVGHPNKYAQRSRELEREGVVKKEEDAMDVDAM